MDSDMLRFHTCRPTTTAVAKSPVAMRRSSYGGRQHFAQVSGDPGCLLLGGKCDKEHSARELRVQCTLTTYGRRSDRSAQCSSDGAVRDPGGLRSLCVSSENAIFLSESQGRMTRGALYNRSWIKSARRVLNDVVVGAIGGRWGLLVAKRHVKGLIRVVERGFAC